MTADRLLATEDLVSGYLPEVNILNGVTMHLDAGEIVAIIGPNGAGKSTLIKTIAGLLRAREGRVIFDGDDITARPAHTVIRSGVAYVPQLDNVFPTMTVTENLELGATPHPKRTRELMERVYELFPLLLERRTQRAGTMSGGQRQMLAFGRALMGDPRLLMLDEPSAGLAPAIVDQVFESIQTINRTGLSVLLVEQNARRALAMSHRGYVLDLGKERFTGPGPELLQDPKVAELYLGGGRRLEEDIPEPGTSAEG